VHAPIESKLSLSPHQVHAPNVQAVPPRERSNSTPKYKLYPHERGQTAHTNVQAVPPRERSNSTHQCTSCTLTREVKQHTPMYKLYPHERGQTAHTNVQAIPPRERSNSTHQCTSCTPMREVKQHTPNPQESHDSARPSTWDAGLQKPLLGRKEQQHQKRSARL
jgi:hypothetical protein